MPKSSEKLRKIQNQHYKIFRNPSYWLHRRNAKGKEFRTAFALRLASAVRSRAPSMGSTVRLCAPSTGSTVRRKHAVHRCPIRPASGCLLDREVPWSACRPRHRPGANGRDRFAGFEVGQLIVEFLSPNAAALDKPFPVGRRQRFVVRENQARASVTELGDPLRQSLRSVRLLAAPFLGLVGQRFQIICAGSVVGKRVRLRPSPTGSHLLWTLQAVPPEKSADRNRGGRRQSGNEPAERPGTTL